MSAARRYECHLQQLRLPIPFFTRSPKATPPSASSRRSSPILSHKPLSIEEAFGPPPHLRGENANSNTAAFDVSSGGGGRPPPPQQQQGQQQQQQRGGNMGGGGGGGGGGRRDLSTVLCFRCGETGHFANHCPNPMKPGDRGGLSRPPRNQQQGGGGGGGGMRY